MASNIGTIQPYSLEPDVSSEEENKDAVEILKTAREILMRVRFFPYNYQRQKERTVH